LIRPSALIYPIFPRQLNNTKFTPSNNLYSANLENEVGVFARPQLASSQNQSRYRALFLRVTENIQFKKFQEENSFLFFTYLKDFEFFTFFTSLQIDIPPKFQVTPPQKFFFRQKTFFLKWSNFLMRKGKRPGYLKLLLKATLHVLSLNLLSTPLYSIFSWQYYHFLTAYQSSGRYSFFLKTFPLTWFSLPNLMAVDSKYVPRTQTYGYWYNTFLQKLNLVFSFYIYKIDKAIYKNSRGRSGKFTFVWKYIPAYKRRALLMFWINKEIQVGSQRTLYARVAQVLQILARNPSSSWIWKIRKFSLNFVYFNFRKSLAETYKNILR
jgi:hypothetical protein